MSNRFTSLSAAAALALAAFTAPAIADEAGSVTGAKTVGAMRLASYGVATSYADVQRQGGFVAPTAVRWTTAPVESDAAAGAVYNAGSVGALTLATLGLAVGPGDVRRQGGALTARNVRWMSAPAE